MKQFVAVRRSTVAVLFASLVFTAVAEVTVSTENFIVRQQWPCSGKIVAEFQVTGEVTAPGATAQVKAYDGDTFICDVPVSEISGDVTITTIGTKRLSFDPTKATGRKVVIPLWDESLVALSHDEISVDVPALPGWYGCVVQSGVTTTLKAVTGAGTQVASFVGGSDGLLLLVR